MTQSEALAVIQAIKWFLYANGLYASIQKVHGECQIVVRQAEKVKPADPDVVGTNSKVGKTYFNG